MDNTELLLLRAKEIKDILDNQKPLYEELNAIVSELSLRDIPETQVAGLYFSIVDNFANKNTVFKATGVNRFDLVIQTEEEKIYSGLSKSEKAAFTRAKNKE